MERLQKFYFQAVNRDNRRVSGSVFAKEEMEAREKLRKQGLAIFSIEPFDEQKAKTPEGLNRFAFEGTNSDGKHIRGKIEAINPYEAYKKLRGEYNFTLNYLVNCNLSPDEKHQIIAEGIPPEYSKLFEEEAHKKREKKDEEENKIETVELSEEDKKQLSFYSSEITRLASEIRALLDNNRKYIKFEKRQEILRRIGLMERLKQSNSLEHLKSLVNKLITELADERIFIEEQVLPNSEKENIYFVKEALSNYSNSKKKDIKKSIAKINSIKIDTKKIKKTLSKQEIIKEIGYTIYCFFGFLLILMLILWTKNTIQTFFLGNKIFENMFLFKSQNLWKTTLLSLSNLITLSPFIFGRENLKLSTKIIFIVFTIFLNLMILTALPSLF